MAVEGRLHGRYIGSVDRQRIGGEDALLWLLKGDGRYIGSVDRQRIDGEGTLLWLLKGDLKVETGSEIMAAQDQELQKKYHAAKILQKETESKCRMQTV